MGGAMIKYAIYAIIAVILLAYAYACWLDNLDEVIHVQPGFTIEKVAGGCPIHRGCTAYILKRGEKNE